MTSTAFRKEEGRVLNRASEILFFFLLILCLFTAVRPCAFFLIISLSSNFGVVFVSGAAGCVATLLHDAVMNPAEVVKQRMQMYNSPYRGVLDCIRAVWQREGAAAFYRSYTTQLTMNVPFQALHFMTYEYLQELLNPHRQYNPSSHMLSGALAGAIAAAATTPLDVCKTLLNTQESLTLSSLSSGQGPGQGQGQGAHRHISGLAHAFRTVYRLGGLQGFFKGVQARVIYQMPSTAISWSVYEFFKYGLTKHQHNKRRTQQIEAET